MSRSVLAPNIDSNFRAKNIFSVGQFDRPSMEMLLRHGQKMREALDDRRLAPELAGQAVRLQFNEPSTRTFESCQRAVLQLGGGVQLDRPSEQTSQAKKESPRDEAVMFGRFSDAWVNRHRNPEHIYQLAAWLHEAGVPCPLINGGNGSDEHPTQAFGDLLTLKQRFGEIDGLRIAIVGDLKYGRTIHSLLKGLTLFETQITLVPIPGLDLDRATAMTLSPERIFIDSSLANLGDCNVWYWLRTQEERFTEDEKDQVGPEFVLTQQVLSEYGRRDLTVLHPLPRVKEIDVSVERHPALVCFDEQVLSGIAARMALFSLVIGK